jgi:hypothetical protein
VIEIIAEGITAPVESVTVPVIEVVWPNIAQTITTFTARTLISIRIRIPFCSRSDSYNGWLGDPALLFVKHVPLGQIPGGLGVV